MKNGSQQKGRKKLKTKDFLESNGDGYPTYPNSWDTMKTVLTGEVIALSAFRKNLKRSYTGN